MAKITIGTKENPIRFSYVNVHKPVSINGGDPKYSASIIIPKSDKKTLKLINDTIEKAVEESRDKFGGKIPNNLKKPLRDGDVDKKGDEAYKNSYFFNASSRIKSKIVDRDIVEIMDESEFYSGCYGRVSINFYGFNTNGNRGIAAGLQNIMKTKDGEALGGRSTAEDDFGDEDDEDVLG